MNYEAIISNLSYGVEIKNWTKLKEYTGDNFTIIQIKDNHIIVQPLNASERKIYKSDFNKVASIWHQYLKGEVKRKQIRGLTHNSKYIISIMKYVNNLSL